MPNTYTQIYIHYVFATSKRMRFLTEERQLALFDYIAGIIKGLRCFTQGIGGAEDHVHLLVGLHPTISVSEFAPKVKANTSRYINDKGWCIGQFQWQEGFGAFSVSQSALEGVREYVSNQAEHHKQRGFMGEYRALLTKYEVSYDEKYLFEEPGE